MSKSIVQVENYIENVSQHRDTIRSYLLDMHNIDIKAIRPRGTVLVGDGRKLENPKQRMISGSSLTDSRT